MIQKDKIKIYEVGPRDGLQNEKTNVPTEIKLALIDKLGNAGLRFIEATSFVSPKWVPQMADHAQVMSGITRLDGVTYAALVPNEKGLEAALATNTKEIAVFGAASESFSQKNINASIAASIDRFVPVIAKAKDEGVSVRGYVSCIAGCPYEGDIAPAAVAEIASTLYNLGCYEISLGDTIGVGTPTKISEVITAVSDRMPLEHIALHCHDTYGQALANIYAGLEQGIRIFDSAVGGLGGCPYAKGASGNVASEDVIYMMDGLGMDTGIDINALIDAAWYITEKIGSVPHSKTAYALKDK